MICSHSACSLSTTASARESASWYGSSNLSSGHASLCGSPGDSPRQDLTKLGKPWSRCSHTSEVGFVEDSLVLASSSATMELHQTQRAQNQVRRWVSTAMDSLINDLEKELESRECFDRKSLKAE